MRILIFSNEFPPGPGGLGSHAVYMASGLRKSGHEVTVFTAQNYADEAQIRDFSFRQTFKVVRWPSGPMRWLRFFMAASALVSLKPDLLVATGDSCVYLAFLTAFLKGRSKFAAVEHGRIPPGAVERKLKRAALESMDLVVCVSEHTKKRMLSMGVRPVRCEVITNGADDEVFKIMENESVREIREKYAGCKILLTVGHVSERKGQEAVIRALPAIAAEIPSAHYFMIGLPTIRKQLEAHAAKLGVSERIHFLGARPQSEVVSWLNACDLFVMTSRNLAADGSFEGFGIAAVEAALCGKPAVVSADSGLTEAIEEGVTGLAVGEDDEAGLVSSVLCFLKDPQKAALFGGRARDRALKMQTWESVVRRYDECFKKLAAEAEK